MRWGLGCKVTWSTNSRFKVSRNTTKFPNNSLHQFSYLFDTAFPRIGSALEYFSPSNTFRNKNYVLSRNWNIAATIWFFYNFQFQKRIVSATSIWGNMVVWLNPCMKYSSQKQLHYHLLGYFCGYAILNWVKKIQAIY